MTTETSEPSSASTRLFDLRWLIAGLFVVYGVVLVVVGLFDSAEEVRKADGIRINLWTGVGMFVLGALFGLWSWWRPLRPESERTVEFESTALGSDDQPNSDVEP